MPHVSDKVHILPAGVLIKGAAIGETSLRKVCLGPLKIWPPAQVRDFAAAITGRSAIEADAAVLRALAAAITGRSAIEADAAVLRALAAAITGRSAIEADAAVLRALAAAITGQSAIEADAAVLRALAAAIASVSAMSAALTVTPSYTANAVHFDGTNDYLTRGAGLTGAADSKQLTISFWVKMAGGDGTTQDFLASTTTAGGTTDRSLFRRLMANNVVIFVRNSTGTPILDIRSSSNSIVVASGWVHVLASVDLADTAKRHLYINDVSDLATVTTYTNETMDFTVGDWSVGAFPNGATKFNGDMADVMFWNGVYLDLSVEANRRLFIDASGKPVDPDAVGGAVATLGTPIIRLTNPTATWHTNVGYGGGFTENGALTDAATSPSD